jgi:hypothetical protein
VVDSRIVLVIGSAADPGNLVESLLPESDLRELFATAIGAPVTIDVISMTPAKLPRRDIDQWRALRDRRPGELDRMLHTAGAARLYTILSRLPVGRLLNSWGPLDPSRVLWRSLRRDPESVALLRGASVIVAVDAPAIRTAWMTLHSGQADRAYSGLAAALRDLEDHPG